MAASGASPVGYNVVKGRKCFAKRMTITPDPITSIPVRAYHLTIKFERKRNERFVLPVDVTVGNIRDTLNKALFALNCGAYFSMAGLGKWGDVLLTLVATEADALVGYYPAFREAMGLLGLNNFRFTRDTEKVKVFVGMVPLSRFGGGWQPAESEGRTAFDHLATDIEQSKPGVVIATAPRGLVVCIN